MELSPNHETPVLITRYSDLAVRPRFTDNLDPKSHKPITILGEYHFEEEVPCGLSGCHTPHKHGVLFASEDGTESNMGHICGAGHFPDDYIAARKEFRRKQAARAHLDVIANYTLASSTYVDEIDTIWRGERGGDWSDKCLHAYRRSCPRRVCEQLADMSRRGTWTITREYRVDVDDALGLGFRRDSEVESEVTGYVRGGAALLKSVSSVLKPVRDQILHYRTVDPTTLSGRKRAQWAAWVDTIPSALREAQQLIEAAREFYTKENLVQLLKLVRGREERTELRTFIAMVGEIGAVRKRKVG